MDDFDKYTYARTLRFLEAYYPYDNEDVHYADVMLSMNQCKTIDELIEVRERLKTKISKMGSVVILDKLPKSLVEDLSKNEAELSSKNIVLFNHWSTNIIDNLRYDVDSCYDDNLFRLFRESDTITAETCGEFFINLSRCEEKAKYKVPIINVAKERSNIDVSELLRVIAQTYKNFGEHWKKFKEFKEGMNGYNPAKKVVEDDFAYLKKFNWRLLPRQKAEYFQIDREEIKKKEEYENYLKEQKEEREQQEKIEKEKKRKRESILKNILIVIVSIISLGIFLVLVYYAEGYVFAILIILLLMKAGIMK